MLSKSRYEVRLFPIEDQKDGFTMGLFDTFVQAFVVGGGHFKDRRVALTQARLYNQAYERATAP
jgi:hypothetical protein